MRFDNLISYNLSTIGRVSYGEEPPAEGGDAAATAAAAAAATAAAAAAAAAGTGGAGEGAVKLTAQQQAVFDKTLKEKTAEYLNKLTKAQDLLEQIKSNSAKTEDERKNLSQKVSELESTLMTKEQQAAHEAKKIKDEAEAAANKIATERDYWKNNYTTEKITLELRSAASGNKAFDPDQIVDLLERKARLVEVVDSAGQPTGKLEVKVTWDDVDKDGKPVSMQLSPADTVKAMRQKERFANLFIAEGGGTGYVPTRGGQIAGSLDPTQMTQEEYNNGGRERLAKAARR